MVEPPLENHIPPECQWWNGGSNGGRGGGGVPQLECVSSKDSSTHCTPRHSTSIAFMLHHISHIVVVAFLFIIKSWEFPVLASCVDKSEGFLRTDGYASPVGCELQCLTTPTTPARLFSSLPPLSFVSKSRGPSCMTGHPVRSAIAFVRPLARTP